jgi:hypothetical protein
MRILEDDDAPTKVREREYLTPITSVQSPKKGSLDDPMSRRNIFHLESGRNSMPFSQNRFSESGQHDESIMTLD